MGKKPKILVVGSFVMDQIVTTRVFPRQGQTILAERFIPNFFELLLR